jgi:peptidoglycan/xylan/chitin deacetylase (PgdA/CDA1 family)
MAAVTFDDVSPTFLTCSQLENVINLLDDLDVACTFFVVPDNNMIHASEKFKSCLESAMKSGHEIALHGLIHKKNEFGILYPVPLPIPIPSLSKQKEQIKKGIKRMFETIRATPEGFRAPSYFHNSETIKALGELGLKYDSSSTVFKTTHCSLFRIRWLGHYGPFRRSKVVEIPVTGDYTYNLENYGFMHSFKVALRDFDLTNMFHGVFVLNSHPNRLRNSGTEFLRILIRRISKRADFKTLEEIAQTFRDRN